ncbi:MAG: N-acetyl-gamma-glutamyl-phosphate reductase, partial [Bryobacteraceae bacterium]
LLERHPSARPVLFEHRSDGDSRPEILHPRALPAVPLTPAAVKAEKLAVVFLATPAEVSMELAPALLEAGAKVVDLSGAFRLKTIENYTRWYHDSHRHPGLLA